SIANAPHFTPPCATLTTQRTFLGGFFLRLAKQPAGSPQKQVGSVNFSPSKNEPHPPKIRPSSVTLTLKCAIPSPITPIVGESGDTEKGTKKPSPYGEGCQAVSRYFTDGN